MLFGEAVSGRGGEPILPREPSWRISLNCAALFQIFWIFSSYLRLNLRSRKSIATEMYLESPDWEQILEMLPVEESEDMEDKRRFLFTICNHHPLNTIS